MGEGVHGGGACVVGGVHGRGACMVGAHVWQGCAWRGACMHGRRDDHCSGWYASYWNAFLFAKYLYHHIPLPSKKSGDKASDAVPSLLWKLYTSKVVVLAQLFFVTQIVRVSFETIPQRFCRFVWTLACHIVSSYL